MSDQSEILDELKVLIDQLRTELAEKGLMLENISPHEIARLIKEYVLEDVFLGAFKALVHSGKISLEPIWTTVPDTEDHSELLSTLNIDPEKTGAFLSALPLTSYFFGRMFCYGKSYGKSNVLKDELSSNDLKLTTILADPLFNLVGIYRIERMLREFYDGNFTVLLNGAYGTLTPLDGTNGDTISFTTDVTIRLNQLIDGHRIFIKFIAVSEPYQFEVLDGEYVFYNNSESSNGDFELSIVGVTELNYVVVKESPENGVADVLTIEQFTMTGILGQNSDAISLLAPEQQAKITRTFTSQVEQAINEQQLQDAVSLMTEYAQSLSGKKAPGAPDRQKPPVINSPMFYDLENFNGLPC